MDRDLDIIIVGGGIAGLTAALSLQAAGFRPAVGAISPDTIFNSVDLPHPDGPTIDTKPPFGMSMVAPSTASVPPGPP